MVSRIDLGYQKQSKPKQYPFLLVKTTNSAYGQNHKKGSSQSFIMQKGGPARTR
jgi:hypothetical protein